MQACLYQALSKVLLFSRNLEKLGLNTACPVSQVLGSLGMKTTSLEVYQDSNTLCRLTATVVFLSRGNRIPIKISRCSAFRMAVSVVTRHAPRREPLTFNSLHSWQMWEFSFTGRFTTNQTRCAGYWTAQHISTATCRTRNDDRSACEKKELLWLVSVCVRVSPVMRQCYYPFGSWVTCGECLRWRTSRDTMGQNTGCSAKYSFVCRKHINTGYVAKDCLFTLREVGKCALHILVFTLWWLRRVTLATGPPACQADENRW